MEEFGLLLFNNVKHWLYNYIASFFTKGDSVIYVDAGFLSCTIKPEGSIMINSITIRNIEDATAIWLRKEAMRKGVKVETLIIDLINAEMKQDTENAPLKAHHELDSLAGTWNSEQAEEFLKLTGDFEQVDEKLWA